MKNCVILRCSFLLTLVLFVWGCGDGYSSLSSDSNIEPSNNQETIDESQNTNPPPILNFENAGACMGRDLKVSPDPGPTLNTLYVDGKNGDDKNNGSSISTALKSIQRAIDDKSTGPGTTILIREGDYHEALTLKKSGSPKNWLTLKAYDNEKVSLSGSRILTNFSLCNSSSCSGIPNPSSTYFVDVPSSSISGSLADVSLFENDNYLEVSSLPQKVSPLAFATIDHFKKFGAEAEGTTNNIPDNSRTEPDGFWNGAYLWIHSARANNEMLKHTITNYKNKSFSLDSPLKVTIDANRDSYVIINHPSSLNRPGRFIVQDLKNGNYRIMVWPQDPTSINNKIALAELGAGILLGAKNVRIEGLEIKNYGFDGLRDGGIISPAGFSASDISIKNNVFKNITGTAVSIQGSRTVTTNGPFLNHSDIVVEYQSKNIFIENNFIYRVRRKRGIAVSGSENVIIANNFATVIERTSIYLASSQKGQIVGNRLGKSGYHGNTISLYEEGAYLDDGHGFNSYVMLFNKDLIVAMNRIQTNMIALTLRGPSDVTIIGNQFIGENRPEQYFGIAEWGVSKQTNGQMSTGGTENVFIAHNTINGFNAALSSKTSTNLSLFNNILARGMVNNKAYTHENNLYTTEHLKHENFQIGPNEFYETDLDKVYQDYLEKDFSLFENSSAIGRARDISSLLPQLTFSIFSKSAFLSANLGAGDLIENHFGNLSEDKCEF